MDVEKVISRIDALIGEATRTTLFEYCKTNDAKDDLLRSAKLMMDNTEVSIRENVLITMVKVCITGRRISASKKHNETINLVKTLDLDEDTRRFMYECLFDKEGLEGIGLRIFTRPK